MARDGEAFAQLQKMPSVQIRAFPDAVVTGLRQHAQAVIADVINATPLAKEIASSYYAYQQQFQAYQAVSELTYLRQLGLGA